MSLLVRLVDDMKAAMRAGEKDRLQVVRMLKSKLQEKQVARRAEKGPDYELTEDEALRVVSAYAKQRRDSMSQYREAGRDDLAEKEAAELALVERYLPAQLDDAAVRALVAEAVAESGATSMRDIGAVMKVLMPKVRGLADGKRVNELVREALGA